MGLYIMLSAETSFFIARKADGTFKVLFREKVSAERLFVQ
jgi:hypothetical protein